MRSILMVCIVMFLTSLPKTQAQCSKDFYDFALKASGPTGNNICLPIINNGKIEILVTSVTKLENYLTEKRQYSNKEAENYLKRKLITNDTILIDLSSSSWNSLVIDIQESEALFKNTTPATILNKYFKSTQKNLLSKTSSIDIQSKEAKLLIFYLFQHCIITYEDDESGALSVNLMYSRCKNLKFEKLY